ncbi:MAG: helix-turn-helix domain-containing protein, partial [Bacteroidota bacterium]
LYYRLSTVPIRIPPLRERGEDISLLFRKFATEFADKYYVKPIRLSEEAEESLLQYRFPGNIRQLKNLVEQISVLEVDRTITQEKLNHYLPQGQPTLPTLYHPPYSGQQMPEKEILYRILFDMRKDMDELKGLVLDLLHTHHPDVDSQGAIARFKNPRQSMQVIDTHPPSPRSTAQPAQNLGSENLSIELHERKLISQALEKHKQRRRKAAESLGISERTLYRKISQYGLE